MGAAVQAAPLLALATVVPTDTGGDLSLGYIVTQATSNEIEIDGAAITAADPTFGVNTVLGAYAYKNLSQFSTEFVTDAAFNFEQFAADRIAPGAVRQLSADMVGRQRFVGPSRPLGRPHHCRSSRRRDRRVHRHCEPAGAGPHRIPRSGTLIDFAVAGGVGRPAARAGREGIDAADSDHPARVPLPRRRRAGRSCDDGEIGCRRRLRHGVRGSALPAPRRVHDRVHCQHRPAEVANRASS